MSQSSRALRNHLAETRHAASANIFFPRGTVRCINQPLFRSPSSRDVACLLDVDPAVTSWSCLPVELRLGSKYHIPDFAVEGIDGNYLLDVGATAAWVENAAASVGYRHRSGVYNLAELSLRLANARDLLRYAAYNVSLGDKIRLLGALEHEGSMSITDCAPLIMNSSDPIGTIASMVLQRIVDIDLDEEPIGPRTRIRRG